MKIEIWSDYVCPFCYIGKRRLEQALSDFPGEVEIIYKAFQLDPEAKTEDNLSINEVLAKKYRVSIEKAKDMNKNVASQAKLVGLNFNYENMKYPNTFMAHRLVHYASTKGLDKNLSERLFKAHFIENLNIGLKETLVKLAQDIGLDGAFEILASNQFSEEVKFDINEARDIQIQGVPFFVFNRKYAISGAQPLKVFQDTIKKVYEEENKQSPFKIIGDDGGVCNDDGCEI